MHQHAATPPTHPACPKLAAVLLLLGVVLQLLLLPLAPANAVLSAGLPQAQKQQKRQQQ
jgi:hypothetical protein